MTEQELIDTINALIDADVQAESPALKLKDIARRAIDRCGEGVFTTEAVTDLVLQILTVRFEPWQGLPGTRPRLRVWKEGVVRLAPKPSVMEILEAGEPIAVTLARVRRSYPRLTEAAMDAEISAYMAWLQDCVEKQSALARELAFEKMYGASGGYAWPRLPRTIAGWRAPLRPYRETVKAALAHLDPAQ